MKVKDMINMLKELPQKFGFILLSSFSFEAFLSKYF